MADERPPDDASRRTALLLKTIPGWCLLAATIFVILTRDPVSDTLVGTMLGFTAVLLGAPFVLPGRK